MASPTVTVRWPAELVVQVDAAAKAAGITRSEWLRFAAERALKPVRQPRTAPVQTGKHSTTIRPRPAWPDEFGNPRPCPCPSGCTEPVTYRFGRRICPKHG